MLENLCLSFLILFVHINLNSSTKLALIYFSTFLAVIIHQYNIALWHRVRATILKQIFLWYRLNNYWLIKSDSTIMNYHLIFLMTRHMNTFFFQCLFLIKFHGYDLKSGSKILQNFTFFILLTFKYKNYLKYWNKWCIAFIIPSIKLNKMEYWAIQENYWKELIFLLIQ